MENTALTNNAIKEAEISQFVDEYDDAELSEELIADLNLAFEQIERGEGISADEFKERLFDRYGITF